LSEHLLLLDEGIMPRTPKKKVATPPVAETKGNCLESLEEVIEKYIDWGEEGEVNDVDVDVIVSKLACVEKDLKFWDARAKETRNLAEKAVNGYVMLLAQKKALLSIAEKTNINSEVEAKELYSRFYGFVNNILVPTARDFGDIYDDYLMDATLLSMGFKDMMPVSKTQTSDNVVDSTTVSVAREVVHDKKEGKKRKATPPRKKQKKNAPLYSDDDVIKTKQTPTNLRIRVNTKGIGKTEQDLKKTGSSVVRSYPDADSVEHRKHNIGGDEEFDNRQKKKPANQIKEPSNRLTMVKKNNKVNQMEIDDDEVVELNVVPPEDSITDDHESQHRRQQNPTSVNDGSVSHPSALGSSEETSTRNHTIVAVGRDRNGLPFFGNWRGCANWWTLLWSRVIPTRLPKRRQNIRLFTIN
jgi:hypothetical protein